MTQDYAAQLTSRFCHDLANPLGAIGNGLELLTMTGLPASPELALVQDSMTQATAKLKLFRLAFGSVTQAGPTEKEAATFLQTWNLAARVQAELAPGLAITPIQSKLAALCCMCIENALPAGGVAYMSSQANGIEISATGPKVIFDESLWGYVQNPSTAKADIPPARLHFLTAGQAAKDAGMHIAVDHSDAQITLKIS